MCVCVCVPHYVTWWEWSFSDLSCNLNHTNARHHKSLSHRTKREKKNSPDCSLHLCSPLFTFQLLCKSACMCVRERKRVFFSNLVCNESQIELICLSSHKLSTKQALIDRYMWIKQHLYIYLPHKVRFALNSKYHKPIHCIETFSI